MAPEERKNKELPIDESLTGPEQPRGGGVTGVGAGAGAGERPGAGGLRLRSWEPKLLGLFSIEFSLVWTVESLLGASVPSTERQEGVRVS